MTNRVSIIIPAHNEEKVIEPTLAGLIAGVNSGEFEVIVVCNGCTDKTAALVTTYCKKIKCIETPIASKSYALNLGDSEANYFPRIYQDADVVLSSEATRQIALVLLSGKYLAAAPTMRMNFKKASWPVRSYYKVWQKLPYVKEGMIGTGVYALSENGRNRFRYFPQIISDDGYVRALFKTHERTTIDSCYSVVNAPVDISNLLKIKTRSRLGYYELKKNFPELRNNEEKKYSNAVYNLLKAVDLWPKIPVYFFVNIIARIRANRQLLNRESYTWERDESNRK